MGLEKNKLALMTVLEKNTLALIDFFKLLPFFFDSAPGLVYAKFDF